MNYQILNYLNSSQRKYVHIVQSKYTWKKKSFFSFAVSCFNDLLAMMLLLFPVFYREASEVYLRSGKFLTYFSIVGSLLSILCFVWYSLRLKSLNSFLPKDDPNIMGEVGKWLNENKERDFRDFLEDGIKICQEPPTWVSLLQKMDFIFTLGICIGLTLNGSQVLSGILLFLCIVQKYSKYYFLVSIIKGIRKLYPDEVV